MFNNEYWDHLPWTLETVFVIVLANHIQRLLFSFYSALFTAVTYIQYLINCNYALSFFQDEKLKKLVELNGSDDWKLIASLLTVSSGSVGTHMHAHTIYTKMFCSIGMIIKALVLWPARIVQMCSVSTDGRRCWTQNWSKGLGLKRRTRG